VLHSCSTCYKNKEQEYLQNYEFIFAFPKKDLTHEGIPFNIENIKGRKIDCYAVQKDQNGKILQQQNCSHCQPWKSHKPSNLNESELDINALIQYFQKHSIKKISFKNGELIITHNNNNNNNNNNETISSQEENNSQELQLARNIIQKSNLQELTSEELNKMANNNSNQQSNKPNNNALWIGCGIGGTLVIGIIIGWLMRKKTKNK